MSKPLSQPDLVALQQATLRRRWLIALRTQGHRKCSGLCNSIQVKTRSGVELTPIYQTCALGLLGEIVFGPFWWQHYEDGRAYDGDLVPIAAMAGLDEAQVGEIIKRNDGLIDRDNGGWYRPHSYREIADVIEGWFAD